MPLPCFAVVPPGMEAVAAEEIRQLGGAPGTMEKGAVPFHATWDALFRILLRAATLTRVRLRLARFRARHQGALAWQLRQLDLSSWLRAGEPVRVQLSSHQSRMIHERQVAQTVCETLGCHVDEAARHSLHLRIDHERCTLSLDLCGERLDRRGYRLESGKAPLRETLAAGLLRWSGWDSEQPLYAPMCGAGTFAIEAALMASRRAVNLSHDFPFTDCSGLPRKRWQRAYDKATAIRQPDRLPAIMASDIHPGACNITRRNAERAGVADLIQVETADVRQLRPTTERGLVVCNPPFGERLDRQGCSLYRDLGEWYRQYFPTGTLLTICPDIRSIQALGQPVSRQCEIISGGKRLYAVYLQPALDAGRTEEPLAKVAGGV